MRNGRTKSIELAEEIIDAHNYIWVVNPDDRELTIYLLNPDGSELYSSSMSPNETLQINTHDMPPGMYVLNVTDNKNQIIKSEKVVILK